MGGDGGDAVEVEGGFQVFWVGEDRPESDEGAWFGGVAGDDPAFRAGEGVLGGFGGHV